MKLLAGLLMLLLGIAGASQEILPLAEVRPGMQGIGKTVVAGDEISLFTVEVVGIIDEPGWERDFILIRVGGEAIAAAGGVALGMSGSPIYLEGRLVGALSRAAAWAKSPEPIALVTPIEYMLELVGMLEGEPSAPDPEAILPQVRVVEVAQLDPPPADPEVIGALPVTLPLVVSGIGGRAEAALRTGMEVQGVRLPGLESLGLRFLPVGGGAAAPGEGGPLVPGGAVGAALATGDITIGALGTITWVRDDLLLAFGHPFLMRGGVSYPLTRASVIDTVEAYDLSFKIGLLGEQVGAVLQDRLAGIGGRLGAAADTISLALEAHCLDRGGSRDVRLELARIPGITELLLFYTSLWVLDISQDEVGPGTVSWECRVEGRGLPRPLVRRDVIASFSDRAPAPAFSVWQLMDELRRNPFAEVEPERIQVRFDVTGDIRALRIIDLSLDRELYAPGDAVRFTVELQTFYGELEEVEGELRIPEDLEAFHAEVWAYAGVPFLYSPPPARSMEEFLAELEGRPRNSTLVVELRVWEDMPGIPGTETTRSKDERFVTTRSFGPWWLGGLWEEFDLPVDWRVLDRVEREFPGHHIFGQVIKGLELEIEFDFPFPSLP